MHTYMYHLVHHWADVISATRVSIWLQDHLWVIPTSQSIHIVCVSIVFGSAVMLSLRLLGLSPSGRSVSKLADTLVPWMYRALALLLLTGSLQTFAEPMRQFVTPAFWWKMSMIVCVVILTAWFARSVRKNAARWDAGEQRPVSAKIFALVSLGLWIGIIFCGRFIGYTWQFYV
jgi:hypothetical protein